MSSNNKNKLGAPKLTKFQPARTVLTSEFLNSIYYDQNGETEEGDPLYGHVHDGQRLDGHAQQIDLTRDVTGKLPQENLDINLFESFRLDVTGTGDLTGDVNIIAESSTDNITFVAGNGINLQGDNDLKKIIISSDSGDIPSYSLSATAIASPVNSAGISLSDNLLVNDIVKLTGGGSVSISKNSGQQITISATDTNTTYSLESSEVDTSKYSIDLVPNSGSTTSVVIAGENGISIEKNIGGELVISSTAAGGKTYDLSAAEVINPVNTAAINLTDNLNATDAVNFTGSGAVTISKGIGNVINVSSTDTNTTYDLAAASVINPANTAAITLTDNLSSTDSVNLTGSGSTTISKGVGNTINISSTDTNTTYDLSAVAVINPLKTAAIALTDNLNSTDSVNLTGLNGATVSKGSGNTINIDSVKYTYYADQNLGQNIGKLLLDGTDGSSMGVRVIGGSNINILVDTNNKYDFTISATVPVAAITAGTGIITSNNSGNITINNDGVTSFNGQKGAIDFSGAFPSYTDKTLQVYYPNATIDHYMAYPFMFNGGGGWAGNPVRPYTGGGSIGCSGLSSIIDGQVYAQFTTSNTVAQNDSEATFMGWNSGVQGEMFHPAQSPTFKTRIKTTADINNMTLFAGLRSLGGSFVSTRYFTTGVILTSDHVAAVSYHASGANANGGRWSLVANNGTTNGRVDTGVVVAPNTTYDIEIGVTPGNIFVKINNTIINSNQNIPNGFMSPHVAITTSVTSQKTINFGGYSVSYR